MAGNGRVFEGVASRLEQRPALDLYHSALEVRVDGIPTVIEMTPIRRPEPGRNVAVTGAVGLRCAGRLRIFRYEVCRWRGGVIPDVAEAVASPQPISRDRERARRVLDLVPHLPTPVWGRDELGAGEMWNSNSVTAWLLAAAGVAAETISPPPGGRAPGWRAGCVVARTAPEGAGSDGEPAREAPAHTASGGLRARREAPTEAATTRATPISWRPLRF